MITSMHIENFKCFKDFTIDLGPFNVLIGPNDSGKTSFLQAIRLLSLFGERPELRESIVEESYFRGIPVDYPVGLESVWRNAPELRVVIAAAGSAQDGQRRGISVRAGRLPDGRFCYWSQVEQITVRGLPTYPHDQAEAPRPQKPPDWSEWHAAAIGRVPYLRFVPDALRKPSPLTQETLRMAPNGEGLANYLQDIWGADGGREAFLAMEQEFYRRFPEYKQLVIEKRQVRQSGQTGPAVSFATRHAEKLTADSVSDGAILALGYLAVCYNPVPPRILLVEEPETGIHHSRLKEVIQTLRGLVDGKGVQVIMTTHSPYLLDEAEMNEVHVFEKDAEGAVHAKKLLDYEGAAEISNMFSTGEKWSLLSEKFGI